MVPRNEEQLRRPAPNTRLLSVQSIVSKHSLRSYSSSFEADDERSTSTESGRMTPAPSIIEDGIPPTRYHGEDTRPTSPKELAGWYMYAFAAETYVVCGKSSVLMLFPQHLLCTHATSTTVLTINSNM